MQIRTRRTSLIAILATIALTMLGVVAIAPASANGFTFDVFFPNAQRGDHFTPVPTYPGNQCPNLGVVQELKGTLIDANNNSFTNFAGHTSADGRWSPTAAIHTPAVIDVPSTAAIGPASIYIECWNGSTLTQSYEPLNVTIVAQSNNISLSNAHWLSTGHFHSETPCVTGASYVEADIYSENVYSVGTPTHRSFDLQGGNSNLTYDSDGNWSIDLAFTPENGFYPDEVYYAHVSCQNIDSGGPWYHYDSFRFSLSNELYDALGDSYSSGEGSYNYDITTGDPACHRSTDSYPYYVAGQLPTLGLPNFGACSGAMTDDMYNINPNRVGEIPQFDRLSSDTKYVTITIGGNDMGFAGVMANCVNAPGNSGFGCSTSASLQSTLDDRLTGLAGTANYTQQIGGRNIHSIEDVLTGIANRSGPDVAIYIAGYPHLFGSDIANYAANTSAPGGAQCVVTLGGTVSFDDAQWLNDETDALNSVLQDAVDLVHAAGVDVTYVPPTLFSGHGLCDDSSTYINLVSYSASVPPVPYSESFHPTVEGMQMGYGLMFQTLMG